MSGISIIDGLPPAETFVQWRSELGWGDISLADAKRSLAKSTLGALAVDGNSLVGFGRVVGDGVLYFYIQDMIVSPERQGEGIGGQLLEHLLKAVREMALPGAVIGLMAAYGKDAFYERYGFVRRPNDVYGAGMTLVLP